MPLGHRSARRRGMLVGAAIASSKSKKQASTPSSAPVSPSTSSANTNDTVTEIKRFAELRDQGILTEEEFTAKKKKLLGL